MQEDMGRQGNTPTGIIPNIIYYSNSSGQKKVLEKLRFREGLMWKLGLTIEIKLRLQVSMA